MSNKPQLKNNNKKEVYMYISREGRDAYGSISRLESSGEDRSGGCLGE